MISEDAPDNSKVVDDELMYSHERDEYKSIETIRDCKACVVMKSTQLCSFFCTECENYLNYY